MFSFPFHEMIFKIHRKQRDFTQVSNAILERQGMSFKAKGVLCYLLSKPESWVPRIGEISTLGPDGKNAIQTALKELAAFGYAHLQMVTENGRAAGKAWAIHEDPSGRQISPTTGKPDCREIRSSENHVDSNTVEESNTEKDSNTEAPAAVSIEEIPEEIKENWELWKQHLREKKVKHTPLAAKLQLRKLTAMGSARANDAIVHSIANGYRGIYEPRQNDQTKRARELADLANRDYSKF